MAEFALQWKNVNFAARQGFWMTASPILREIDIQVDSGSALGIVGPNGAGKTTTLKIGAGLLVPQSGGVFIRGIHASEAHARKHIGMLTETPYVYPYLRLREWLSMLGGLSGLKGERLISGVENILSLMKLNDCAEKMMRTLSKGQLQRAGIAQALVHDPSILLLDEPMSGLDPYWRYHVQKLLIDFKSKGGTIIFSSHIISDVERISDKVVLINKGKIKWSGSLQNISRDAKGYEVVCRIVNGEPITQYVDPENEPVFNSSGNWIFNISVDQKNHLLALASQGKLELESLNPILDEVEELLFGFNPDREDNSNIRRENE